MMFLPRSSLFARTLSVVVSAALFAGCATQSTLGGIASVRDAQARLAIGKSTKAEVEAALGQAVTVRFDSGYEAWVYRERGGGGLFARSPYERPELVLLFEPGGTLKKVRTRIP